MAGEPHPQKYLYDTVGHDVGLEPRKTLRSIPSNAIVVRDQVGFYRDVYEAPGSGKAMFQFIKNNHEVIVWGPPVVVLTNLMVQLELIETLLNSIDFDDIRQAMLYIASDGHARLIPQEEKHLRIPYLAGYRCVDESQLQVTEWLQAGWKRALLDGIRPVEVEYAYNHTSSLALQCMMDGCQKLEPLDLTTPILACLARDGRMIGVVKCVEEGTRMVSYKDRTLVYNAFQKMQQNHIYLLDGHDIDPSAVLIVDDKVRFVDMALKRWFSPNIFIYDRTVHAKQQLKQAQQSHWRQADLLFERINTGPAGTSSRYQACVYHLINVIFSPEIPLVAFSARPPVVSKGRKRRRKRSSKPQIAPDAACDGEYPLGRDGDILTGRFRIALTQRKHFVKHPGPHMTDSETSHSSLGLPSASSSSRSLYPVPSTPHDASSLMTRRGSTFRRHRISYSNRSGPSPFCDGENIPESSWLEELEF
ncbi:uncharacterized protein EV420DRAFT_1653292 [Desarmillaria tabescens]|uniref:Uncharacterized protein n=1 Tax=Armillaria tabescens TaxID=1929756 RepID=A0AA39J499_ARMTA|nr:uncharacterized protein EV420DRAFT_1653292 [Desarmillaria tabescens]KAK0435329.1 hypothetical protein EV420DRAFT_1653292 [Desarmillaria tabescens]